MSRLPKEKYWMGVAEAVSLRSHDEETKVGGILIKNDTGMIVATGHNGFVRGADDTKLPKTRPNKYKYMVHAEENLLSHAAKNGINIDDTTLVITMSPCQRCLRLMWQAGVTTVVCKDLYKDFSIDMEDINITQEITENGFYILKYNVA
jgi:dCMP deaminase